MQRQEQSDQAQANDKKLLPCEDVTVFVNIRKLTSDLAKAVRYEVGKEQAHVYLTSHKGCAGKYLGKVDCARLQISLG